MIFWYDFFRFLIFVFLVYLGYRYIYDKVHHYQPLSPKNRAVFVSGCDSGFGYFTAKRLTERGYRVFAGCLFPEGQGAKELRAFSSKIEVLPLDVTNEKNIKEVAKTMEAKLGTDYLWALVNNAGRMHTAEIEWCPVETCRYILDVNVLGIIRMVQTFLPLLRKSKGRIINVTSISAVKNTLGVTPYSLSKSASTTLTNGLRIEMKKWDIKVINIQPYFYDTPSTTQEAVKAYLIHSWNNADPKITSALGDEYLEVTIKRYLGVMNLLKNDQLESVIQAYEHAVTSPKPKSHYCPGNFTNKLVINTVHYLPSAVQDFIEYMFC